MIKNIQDLRKKRRNQLEVQNLKNREKREKTFWESSIAITLAAAVLYIVGYARINSYYSSLLLPTPDNFSIFDYMSHGFLIAFSCYICLFISFWSGRKSAHSFLRALGGNFFLIALTIMSCLLLVAPIFEGKLIEEVWLNLLFFLVFLAVLIFITFACFKHWSVTHLFYTLNLPGKIFCFVIIAGWLIRIVINTTGFQTEFLVRTGSSFASSHSQIVSVILSDESQLMPEKDLIFINHYNSNYYLVEKNASAPEKPVSYIIPENKVQFLKIGASQ